MIKGKNQHVMPHGDGWCVIDEADQQLIKCFHSRTEAIDYARICAIECEGEVLIHSTEQDFGALCSVSLPQREFIRGTGYLHPTD